MADDKDTAVSNHVPVLEAVQPPKYTTDIPQTLLGQIIALSVMALIILCFLVWAEMPPIAIGFAFVVFAVLVGLAVYNATVMRATSGTETKHILEVRNAQMEAQTADAMMATSQNNKLIEQIMTNAIQAQSLQPGMIPPPIQGQFTHSAPLRKPVSQPRIAQNNSSQLLEYDNDS